MKKNFNIESLVTNSAMFLNEKKDRLILFYGQSTFEKNRDPNKNQVFVSNYGLSKRKPFLSFEKVTSCHVQDFVSFLKKEKKSRPHFNFKEKGYLKYKRFFNSVMTLIHNKTLTKAVPYTYLESKKKPLTPDEKIYLLSACLNHSLHAKSFFYAYFSFKKVLIGSSPEIFLLQKRKLFTTDAIAGTLKNTSVNRKRILDDKKLKQEQNLVINSIKKSLCHLGELRVSKKELLELKSLIHIKNKISFKSHSDDLKIKDLISRLHPTAALGTLPKDMWRQVEDMNPYSMKRQSFGSPIGFFYKKTTFLIVAIRALECFDNKAYLFAGGGVISLSKVESEWHELKLKLNAIKLTLGL